MSNQNGLLMCLRCKWFKHYLCEKARQEKGVDKKVKRFLQVADQLKKKKPVTVCAVNGRRIQPIGDDNELHIKSNLSHR